MFAINMLRKYLQLKIPASDAAESIASCADEKRFDKNPLPEENVEKKYTQRLAFLSEVTNELSKERSPDDLYRRVVELGREKLDLDRLSLLFMSRDKKLMKGTFGVDTNGDITDERNETIPLEPTSPIQPIVQGRKLLMHFSDAPLYLSGRVVGRGAHIVAGLWDGECVIGFMTVDNLLRKRPFSDRDEEIIRMFAVTVGHLCSLKTAEKERENLQAQLLYAQKMESVGRLAGNVAHDFNNMLGVIIGFAELAAIKLEPDHPLQADLDHICKVAQRSASLAKQLLAFAQKQDAIPTPMNLNAAVPELLKMLSHLLGPEIKINWQPGNNLWNVLLDPAQFDQVLTNVCVNARDAITGNGHIRITTENVTLDEHSCERFDACTPGKYVLLAVTDNGCGMNEAVKSRLFEPFFTTKVHRGSGLGLATVYGIVQQNKGFIRIESKQGKGTTVFIYLPRLKDSLPAVPSYPAKSRAAFSG